MTLVCEDWRDADPGTIEPLYAAERARWQDELAWDSRLAWATVEAGRRRGTVSGWLLRDPAGCVRGWTYFLLFEGELQIGALVAERAVDVRQLLDQVIDAPEASRAATISCFAYPAQPSLLSALRRRRFVVRQSIYMSRLLTPADGSARPAPDGVRIRPYRATDLFPVVRLMASAYEGRSGAVCFAPHGRLDEWVRYTRQLIETQPCGPFQPEASLVAEDSSTGRLLGTLLCTAVSQDVAHVAQLIVDPGHARRGLGSVLMAQAYRAAHAAGQTTITLMVDESNTPARSLYRRDGFSDVSAFVSARRPGQMRTYASVPRVTDAQLARQMAS